MQQLTAFEMENISGGTISLENLANGLLDAATFVAKEAGAGIFGAAIGALDGASFGLSWAGEGVGILGFGLIGGWVGAVGGAIVSGAVLGTIGVLLGWDTISDLTVQSLEGLINGTFNFW